MLKREIWFWLLMGLIIVAGTLWASMGFSAVDSVFFGETSNSFLHLIDKIIFFLFSGALIFTALGAVINWFGGWLAPNLSEATSIIEQAASKAGDKITNAQAMIAVGVLLSTTARLWIVFDVLQNWAVNL